MEFKYFFKEKKQQEQKKIKNKNAKMNIIFLKNK